MITEFSTPVLESRTSAGNAKYWQGHVAHNGDLYYTYTTYWQDLADGGTSTVQESVPTKVQPKNVGRANSMASKDQAYFEMNSTVKKQKDKGYYELGGKSDKLTLPMLALQYEKTSHRITYPCTLQPKYDGNRCLSDGKRMWSRKGIEFIPECVAHFFGTKPPTSGQITLDMLLGFDDGLAGGKLDTLGYITDGELIMPHGTLLQKTNSAIKKFDPALSPHLLYRIYDVVDEKLSYPERYEIVKKIVAASKHGQIQLAPVAIAQNEDDILDYHDKCKAEGWEGAIIRLHGEGYRVGQRVSQLIKLKDFKEAEFLVVNVEPCEKGKYEGCARLICKTDAGIEFKTLPVGSIEYKKELLANKHQVVGTMWTIRYQDPNESGVPQFGRAICERVPEISG